MSSLEELAAKSGSLTQKTSRDSSLGRINGSERGDEALIQKLQRDYDRHQARGTGRGEKALVDRYVRAKWNSDALGERFAAIKSLGDTNRGVSDNEALQGVAVTVAQEVKEGLGRLVQAGQIRLGKKECLNGAIADVVSDRVCIFAHRKLQGSSRKLSDLKTAILSEICPDEMNDAKAFRFAVCEYDKRLRGAREAMTPQDLVRIQQEVAEEVKVQLSNLGYKAENLAANLAVYEETRGKIIRTEDGLDFVQLLEEADNSASSAMLLERNADLIKAFRKMGITTVDDAAREYVAVCLPR